MLGVLIGIQPSEARRLTVPQLMTLAEAHARANNPDQNSEPPPALDEATADRIADMMRKIAG